MIQQVGAIVIFLPLYSPDYNPIEELFSKVKKVIKWYENDLHNNEMDLQTIIQAVFCLRTAVGGLQVVAFITQINSMIYGKTKI